MSWSTIFISIASSPESSQSSAIPYVTNEHSLSLVQTIFFETRVKEI